MTEAITNPSRCIIFTQALPVSRFRLIEKSRDIIGTIVADYNPLQFHLKRFSISKANQLTCQVATNVEITQDVQMSTAR